MGLLTSQQILEMGFKSVGNNVSLSDKSSYYNCKNICIGNNVRVDDFCVLSAGVGGIEIGSYVHIAVYTSLIGAGKITLSDFCNISSKVAIYSSSDDYSGEAMTNPMVPTHLTKVEHADVFVSRHVIVGSGSVILPGVTLAEGVAIGAMSLVKSDCESFGIFAGIPVKRRGTRRKDILDLEKIISI